MKRYLITSALPYASGVTHLGNVVGSTLPADVYARFCRLRGRQTLYVCGSDEHGVAITIAAEKERISPRELIDRYHGLNAKALDSIGIAFDIYDRTSNPIHAETAREFFSVWGKKGLLVEREEDQFFDDEAQIFLPDRYVEGVCPNCGYDRARGDQCDNCGAYYNQLDLKNPRSLVSGKSPVVRSTKHWYFRLDAFQEWTENYIESHTKTWKDNVLQQSRSWLKQGLAERAATRDMTWGIPVPVEGADGKVLYVWFEAVLGYISATKQWALNTGTPEAWKDWWQNSETTYTAFLGKDNIVFHTIIFPILLQTRADEGYILPENVPANEFLNLEGQRFSKSRNWFIDVLQYREAFPEDFHVDMLRYVLVMNMPETKDSDFTWRDFQARTNNELASILGNYVNRSLQFLQKNFASTLPTVDADFVAAWNTCVRTGEGSTLLRPQDIEFAEAIRTGLTTVAENYDRYRFRDAATETMSIARAANKYFNDLAPWKALKTDEVDCAKTMFICTNAIRTLAIGFAPLLPRTSERLLGILGLAPNSGAPQQNTVGSDVWLTAGEATLEPATVIAPPEILFTRIEDDVMESVRLRFTPASTADTGGAPSAPLQSNPSTTSSKENDAEETVATIDIATFAEVKLRTARVISAERITKSEKLLKLQVDLGNEQRQILAGIAKHYAPEDLVGTLVVIVANLKPAKLMGMESQGMVLAASNADGTLSLVTPRADVGPGAEVR